MLTFKVWFQNARAKQRKISHEQPKSENATPTIHSNSTSSTDSYGQFLKLYQNHINKSQQFRLKLEFRKNGTSTWRSYISEIRTHSINYYENY